MILSNFMYFLKIVIIKFIKKNGLNNINNPLKVLEITEMIAKKKK